MSTTPPAFTLIVATLHAPPTLTSLVESLTQQDWKKEDQVIFIDNGGEQNHKTKIKAFFPMCEKAGLQPVYLREDQLGLIYARLAGFRNYQTDWIILLDDDNSFASDAIAALRCRLREYPDLGGICPRIEPLWNSPPQPWVIALGHDVLSYNCSSLHRTIPDWIKWAPGKKGQRPPGGGMIIHRRAVTEFIKLIEKQSEIKTLGHLGASLGSGEDYLLYEQIYHLGMATAYDANVQIYHHIPDQKQSVDYFKKIFYGANFGFARVALMLKGKWLFPASLLHALCRLTGRYLFFRRYSQDIMIKKIMIYAFIGYFQGTIYHLYRCSFRK